MTENNQNQEIVPEEVEETVVTNDNSSDIETENQAEEAEAPSEVEKLTAEIAEAKDKYLRMYADFENFRRRTAKEKIDLIQNASEGLIKDLLPVLDDFERANKSIETTTDIAAIKEGIDLIFNKLQKTLASKGLKSMESKDTDFDVELHECITQFAASDDKKGKVIDEVEKGYFLNEKVIRYAKVVVGN